MLYIIAFWHLSGYSGIFEIPYGEYLKNASLGLFMFVSGFLLGMKYKIRSLEDAKFFILKRFFRLYPLYALSLLLFWAHSAINTKTLLLSLVGASTFFPPQPPTLWFVSMLLVFYVLFVFLSGLEYKYKLLFILIVYSIMIVLCFYNRAIDHRVLYYFPCFGMGTLLSDTQSLFDKGLLWGCISLVFFVAGVWVLETYQLNFISYCLVRFGISMSGCYLMLLLAKMLSRITLTEKIFNPLSYASLAAYMFHRQIISAIRMIYWPDPSMWRVFFLYVVCIPVVLGSGYIIQLLYDKTLLLIRGRLRLIR